MRKSEKSEIDDIFASKGRIASSSNEPSPTPAVKRKAKKKRAQQCLGDISQKRPVPETVFDPSVSIPPPAKRLKQNKGPDVRGPKSGKDFKEKVDQERFMDSRGSGPRRKTEEGYSIYKESELGMRDEGGDTPLCPFDCQCCF